MASFLKWLFSGNQKTNNALSEEKENLSKTSVLNNNIGNNSEEELINDNGLRVLTGVMLFGFFALILISVWACITDKISSFWGILGLSSLVGLAAVVVGGLMGFLFGIPRSLQRADGSDPQGRERKYSNNTNLEQISDWLTKIIVGVGLTQLPAIESRYDLLTRSVANGFDNYISPTFAYPFASGIMIFYAICGFLTVYIWAKVYFMKQLWDLDNFLDGSLKKSVQIVSNRNQKIELNQLNNTLTDFNRRKNRILEYETQPEYKAIIDVAKPQPIQYIEDVQKERWGGKDSSNGYKLEATIAKSNDGTGENFDVTLTVHTTDPGIQLVSPVYFFLHDSFYQEYIKKVTPENNQASTSFASFEAFTVAAVLNGGTDKLELDLNSVTGCPESYKYTGDLLTVEDIQSYKKKIEEEQKAQNQSSQ